MSGRRTASLAGLPLALMTVAACMTWHHSSAPAPAAIARKPALVRILRSDNSTIEIRKPEIAGDSIVGVAAKPAAPHSDPPRVAVAVSDVKRLDVRGVSTGRTIALVGGLGATAILVAAAAASDPTPQPVCTNGCVASCPFVYSWDGRTWRLDSGTFGGAILPALARTDVDNIDFATARGDSLYLRVTNELEETDHIDALQVLVVDYDPRASVAPGPDGRLHAVGDIQAPLAARDFGNRDVLDRVVRPDGWGWESSPSIRDTTSEVRDGVTLVFRRAKRTAARLVIDAHNTPWAAHLMRAFVQAHGRETESWYDSAAADPRHARLLGEAIAREAFLSVSVRKGDRWVTEGLAWEAGPEVVKRQVLPLDLHGVTGDSVVVRLESATGLWRIDAAGIDFSDERMFETHEVAAARAVDRIGRDVQPLITSIDGREYVASPGDTTEFVFALPPALPGRARSYLLQSTGWYRIHTTATGEPDRATLARIGREPGALSRIATARLNDAILAAARQQ